MQMVEQPFLLAEADGPDRVVLSLAMALLTSNARAGSCRWRCAGWHR